jgi:hypothetical protein
MYRPLDNSPAAIRLLHLLPSTTENEPISCLLTHKDLGNEPRYMALSYYWGDSSSPSQIFVNRSPLPITRNLASALLYIRKHFASGLLGADLPRAFWIDAICINQEDVVERTGQVAMMSIVYASATNVVSWLGSDEGALSTVPIAFEFIRNVVQATRSPNSASSTRRQQLEQTPSLRNDTVQQEIIMDTIADPRLLFILSKSNSIVDFFALSYWHRIWIVQEIVLTKPEDNFILYGDELISLHDVQIFRDSWLTFLKTL